MPLRKNNTRTFHRTLYAGELQTITLLKRGDDQQEGTVRKVILFDCLLPGTEVEGRATGVEKALYIGEAVEIISERGSSLKVTINHPVLTLDGFVPAGEIEPGNYLVCDNGDTEVVSKNIQNGPFLIEDVFESFSKLFPTITRPASPFEFHGDGASMKGQIHVVGTDGILLRNRNFESSKISSNSIFNRPNSVPSKIKTRGLVNSVREFSFVSPNSIMSGLDLTHPLLVSHMRPFKSFGLTSCSDDESFFFEETGYCTSIHTKSLSKRRQCFSGNITGTDFFDRKSRYFPMRVLSDSMRLGQGSRFDAVLPKKFGKDIGRNTKFLPKLSRRFPGEVSFDKILKVRRFHYDGPVYNLETTLGYYTASTMGRKVFVANCRRESISKTGQAIQGEMSSLEQVVWQVPAIELARNGVNYINVLDRIVDMFNRFWQPESGQSIHNRLFENQIFIYCVRVDPPSPPAAQATTGIPSSEEGG